MKRTPAADAALLRIAHSAGNPNTAVKISARLDLAARGYGMTALYGRTAR